MISRAMSAGAMLLVGSPMPDRSKGRGETKSDPLVLQVGVGQRVDNPLP